MREACSRNATRSSPVAVDRANVAGIGVALESRQKVILSVDDVPERAPDGAARPWCVKVQ